MSTQNTPLQAFIEDFDDEILVEDDDFNFFPDETPSEFEEDDLYYTEEEWSWLK
jgi:hypothetical protein